MVKHSPRWFVVVYALARRTPAQATELLGCTLALTCGDDPPEKAGAVVSFIAMTLVCGPECGVMYFISAVACGLDPEP